MDIYERYHKILYDWYPELAAKKLHVSPFLISPYQVPVQSKILDKVSTLLATLNRVANLSDYQQALPPATSCLPAFNPGNHGVLTSLDCHINHSGPPKLIEVNTNAAFGLAGEVLYAAHDTTFGLERKMTAALKKSFLNEITLFTRKITVETVAIIDEKPVAQNFYFEFLMYKQLFEELGWQVIIDDPGAFSYDAKTNKLIHKTSATPIQLVYNRYTDFYLQSEPAQQLKTAYCNEAALFTPHPREYWLKADKSRLVQLSQPDSIHRLNVSEQEREILNECLPKTWSHSDFKSKDDLWERRKHMFFKPISSHGSKAVYRGANISRKILDQIWASTFVAQEHVPPSLFTPPQESEPFKLDLRCISYLDQVQIYLVRLYRGQLTNFKSANGGIAIVTPS